MAQTKEERRLGQARARELIGRSGAPTSAKGNGGAVREDYSENGGAWDYFTMIRRDPVLTDGVRTD